MLLCIPAVNNGLHAEEKLSALGKLIGDNDAILVADSNGKIIFEKNADKKLVPASILKILTSLAALRYLGFDYRFQTEFYMDNDSNLKVKGYGDPLLTSEVLTEITKALGSRIKYINDVVLDDSYFNPTTAPGVTSFSLEPYDSPNGALCANFNTVSFNVSKGKYISTEKQTPLLPFALNKINKYAIKRGRILLSSEPNEITLYAGHLISYFLEKEGLKPKGKIRIGTVQNKTDRLVLKYTSTFSMEEVISRLLFNSNNFIANQLVLAIGAKIHGQPGTLEKGVSAINDYARNILNINDLSISEGSGISRENRISAKSFLKILVEFEPHMPLIKHSGNEFFKTGTLTGVSTRAGYIKGRNGVLFNFVILTNSNGKSAKIISKKLCRLLAG